MADPRLTEQLRHTLRQTDFPTLGQRYQGKVRDTYRRGDALVLITTDRLSAFDRVLTTLPFKGDLLNTLSHYWFKRTAHVAKNHVIDMPDPCATVARLTEPLKIEFVVRGYLTGSLWRDYTAGNDPYGLGLPPGLRKDSRFDAPLLTPSTKAPAGEHDLPLSEAEVIARNLVPAKRFQEAKALALGLFAEGTRLAKERGLLFVDTKYEFGLAGDQLLLIDEIHTPDSSRFWVASEYEARLAKGEPQRMLDKENLRQWLINERGFSGHGEPPTIPDEIRVSLTEKYLGAYEQLTGAAFPLDVGSVAQRLEQNLRRAKLL